MTRLARADWSRIHGEMDERGWSVVPAVLSARECRALADLFDRDALFRSTVTMQRVGYGHGVYRYFADPLPPLVEALRHEAYAHLAPLANEWAARLRRDERYPAALAEFLARCHRAGQERPTPLLLRYRTGDFNRLHQDVYGAVAFPLQMLILLSEAGEDYDGGEVILLEQRPRMQSRATAITPRRGEALVFPNRDRPVRGSRGDFRAQMRHGASEVRRGERVVLGLIFHDGA
jgi:hypothetical protein